MSNEKSFTVGWLDRFRYFVLAPDPGLQQLKHAAKTVVAVAIALEAFRSLHSQAALYAGMSAGFLMQSTAGSTRRTRQLSMAAMGVASTIAVGLGSELSGQHGAKEALLVAAAFGAFYVRKFIPGKAMFPMFAFVLTLLATVQPGGAGGPFPMMLAVFGGFSSAYLIYFYVLPDESLRAFRHAADLFLFRLRHARRNPGNGQNDLRAMHKAVAFEAEEMEALGALVPSHCAAFLANQYEALQVLIVLFDVERHSAECKSAAQEAAEKLCRGYLADVAKELRQSRELIDA